MTSNEINSERIVPLKDRKVIDIVTEWKGTFADELADELLQLSASKQTAHYFCEDDIMKIFQSFEDLVLLKDIPPANIHGLLIAFNILNNLLLHTKSREYLVNKHDFLIFMIILSCLTCSHIPSIMSETVKLISTLVRRGHGSLLITLSSEVVLLLKEIFRNSLDSNLLHEACILLLEIVKDKLDSNDFKFYDELIEKGLKILDLVKEVIYDDDSLEVVSQCTPYAETGVKILIDILDYYHDIMKQQSIEQQTKLLIDTEEYYQLIVLIINPSLYESNIISFEEKMNFMDLYLNCVDDYCRQNADGYFDIHKSLVLIINIFRIKEGWTLLRFQDLLLETVLRRLGERVETVSKVLLILFLVYQSSDELCVNPIIDWIDVKPFCDTLLEFETQEWLVSRFPNRDSKSALTYLHNYLKCLKNYFNKVDSSNLTDEEKSEIEKERSNTIKMISQVLSFLNTTIDIDSN